METLSGVGQRRPAAAAFVSYGVTMGDGAGPGAAAILMKGEQVPPGACWGRDPAAAIRPGPDGDPAAPGQTAVATAGSTIHHPAVPATAPAFPRIRT